MRHFHRLLLAVPFLAILLTAVPAGAQDFREGFGEVGMQGTTSNFGGPYYRGANNPSGYYRDFTPPRRYRGGFGFGGAPGFIGQPDSAGFDAFGDTVAGPFGHYRGYGDYFTRGWWRSARRW